MNKMEIVPRIRIGGKYYTFDELPEEKVVEIVEQRIDLAMTGIHYERCSCQEDTYKDDRQS